MFARPPSAGKTVLPIALGRAAADTGHRVYFTTAAKLAARSPPVLAL
ncbi:ATP-binding protein [Streptomyces sp. NPDC012756]